MVDQYRTAHAGLKPCCLASLDAEMSRRQQLRIPLGREGETLRCEFEKGTPTTLVFKRGAWRWAGPRARGALMTLAIIVAAVWLGAAVCGAVGIAMDEVWP